MFSTIISKIPRLAALKIVDQMVDEKGVLIAYVGVGREGHWIMSYADPGRELVLEFFAYRASNLEESFNPPTDYWRADLGFRLKEFAIQHPEMDAKQLMQEVASNIAECLFCWPIDRFNPFQAKRVIVTEHSLGRLLFELPEKWRSSNG